MNAESERPVCHRRPHRRPVRMWRIGTATTNVLELEYFGCPLCDGVRTAERPLFDQPTLFDDLEEPTP